MVFKQFSRSGQGGYEAQNGRAFLTETKTNKKMVYRLKKVLGYAQLANYQDKDGNVTVFVDIPAGLSKSTGKKQDGNTWEAIDVRTWLIEPKA